MAVRRLLAAVLFLPVLVSCSDDEPDSSGSGDPTTSAHPTPTEPPPPEEPALAGERSKAGAEAFVGYWVETLNYAMDTGDVTRLSALTRPGCESCRSISSTIRDIYRDGGSIESRGWELDRITAIQVLSRASMRASVVLDLPAETIRRPGTEAEHHAALADARARLLLAWSADRWALAEFVRSSS